MLLVFFVAHSEYPNGKMMHCKELKELPYGFTARSSCVEHMCPEGIWPESQFQPL